MTGEDLGYKPCAVEKTKFEYSPLGRVFNRGLNDEDKKEGSVTTVNSIEDRNKELLKAIKGKTDIKPKVDL